MKHLLTLAAFLSLTAAAQNTTPAAVPAKTGVAALPTPQGALLRWTLPGGVLPDQYRLTREGGGQTSTRILPGLVPREEAVRQGWVDAKTYDGLKDLYGKANSSPQARVGRELQLLANANWARTLNLLVTESGLKPGVKYRYTVTAVTGGRETRVGTAEVTTGPTPPVPAPTNLKAAPGVGRAALFWTRAGGLTMAYRIYRAEAGQEPRLLQPAPYFPGVDAARPTQVSYADNDSSLKRRAKYSYRVSAVDLFGRESALTAPLIVDLREGEPFVPLVIEKVTERASASGASVTLGWSKVDDPRVLGITVYRGSGRADLKPLAELKPEATSYTDASATVARTYVYALGVKLRDGQGEPGPFRPVQPMNPAPPAAPTGLKATLENGVVRLSWQASREADVQGYLVVGASKADAPAGDLVAFTPKPQRGTTLDVPLTVVPGTGFSFRVIAVNTSGVNSAPSAAASVSRPARVNTPPTLLSARGADRRITLRWTYPGGTPKQVEVFRRNPNGTTVLVARLPGTVTSYEDTRVVPTLPYGYVVAGVDAAGRRSDASGVQAASAGYEPVVGAVTGLDVKAAPAGARLSWNAAPGAAAYLVTRVRGGTPTLLGTVSALTFSDAGARAGDSYRVTPRALNGTQGEAAQVTFR